MKKQLNRFITTILVIVALTSLFLISFAGASDKEQNFEIKNVININMGENPNQTLTLEAREDVIVGYLLGDEEDIFVINEDISINVIYPENKPDNYSLNINLNYEEIITIGKLEANLLDTNSTGVINIEGEGKLHFLKSADFGLNSLNIKKSQIFLENINLSMGNLLLEDNAFLNIVTEFGTAPSLKVSGLTMKESKLEIVSKFGGGLVVEQNENSADSGNFLLESKSQIDITSAEDGIKAISPNYSFDYSITDSSINLTGNYNGSNFTGLIFSNNAKISSSKINIEKYQNGLTGTNLSFINSEINISTLQQKISDEFGTGIYLSGKLNLDTSNLNIESPLDIGYQNNVQAIWAGEISLGDSSNITENYLGSFHVSSGEEVDIYFNGGIGSQMIDIENYEIISSNNNLVYNEESKKFLSKATRIQTGEVVFKRTKSIPEEKISLGKVSSHKVVVPISLDSVAPSHVEFNSGEGTTVKTQNIVFGDKLMKPEDPKKTGFDFENWYLDESLTEVFDFESIIDKNLTLFASWVEEKPKIMFSAAGGSISDSKETVIKGETGKIIDISSYQKGGENQPVKSGYAFLGWADEKGNIIDNSVNLKDANIKLEAKWLSYSSLLDELDGKNITAYKGEANEDDINNQLINFLEHDVNGEKVQLVVNHEWNKDILNIGGITKAIPYVLDPDTGNKIYGKGIKEANIYILNKPYIQTRRNVTFRPNDKITIDGREWQAVGICELPDYSTKSITRTNFKVIYNGSNVNTFELGEYNVIFSGHVNDLNGDLINVEKTVNAQVSQVDRAGGMFWGELGENIKKLRKNRFYSSDTVLAGGKETQKIVGKSDFDRSMVITPEENTVINPGFLASVGNNKKSLVRIDMGQNQWDLYGKNFVDQSNTGSLDVGVKRVSGEELPIKNLLADIEHEVLHFEMDGRWGAESVFRTKIGFETSGKTPYMFSFNSDTNELELVGVMKKDNDGYHSIVMNRVVADYVITKDLPICVADTENPMITAIPIFRITEATNTIDESVYEKIAASLLETGGDIKNITLVKPVLTDLDAQIDQVLRDRQIVAAILIFLIFILTSIVLINRIIQIRKRKIYSAQNLSGLKNIFEKSMIGEGVSELSPVFISETALNYFEIKNKPINSVSEHRLEEEPEESLDENKKSEEDKKKSAIPEDPKIFYNSALLNLTPKYLRDKKIKEEKSKEAVLEETIVAGGNLEESAVVDTKNILPKEEEKSNITLETIENEPKNHYEDETSSAFKIKLANGPDDDDGTPYVINPKEAMVKDRGKSILALIQNDFRKNTEDIIKEEPEENFILSEDFKEKEPVKFFKSPFRIESIDITEKYIIKEIDGEEKSEEKLPIEIILNDDSRGAINREDIIVIKEAQNHLDEKLNLEDQVARSIENNIQKVKEQQEKNNLSYSFKARVVKEKEEKPKTIKRRTRLDFISDTTLETSLEQEKVFNIQEDLGLKKEKNTLEPKKSRLEKTNISNKQEVESSYKPDIVAIKEVRENYFKKNFEMEKALNPTEEFEKIKRVSSDAENNGKFYDLGHQISRSGARETTRVKTLEEDNISNIKGYTLEGKADLSRKRKGWSSNTKSEIWGSYANLLPQNQSDEVEMFIVDEQ